MSESSQYLVHASYLEIYNEDVRDLLGKDSKQRLDLKEHPEKGVYIQGAVSILILIWQFCKYQNTFVKLVNAILRKDIQNF